jgi:hypothetical protein
MLQDQKLAVLLNEFKSPGEYQADFDGSNYASGVYIYRMKTGQQIISKKMILVK